MRQYSYQVFDLGAHEVLAVFRLKQDALDYAKMKSTNNGPALQVQTIEKGL